MHEASSVPDTRSNDRSSRIMDNVEIKVEPNGNDQSKNGTHLDKFNGGQLSDIMFEDIHYTVSLGWRKGNTIFSFFFLFIMLQPLCKRKTTEFLHCRERKVSLRVPG